MIRELEDSLTIEVKNGRKLILSGISGVGKSSLAQKIAQNGGYRFISCNLRLDNWLKEQLMEKDFYTVFAEMLGKQPDTTMIILNETAALGKECLNSLLHRPCPRQMIILCNHPEWFGGEDPIRLPEDFLNIPVYPYNFEEFLRATDNSWYLDVIHAHLQNKQPIPDLVLEELNECLFDYLLVGGFPGPVKAYTEHKGDIEEIYRAHKQVYSSLLQDFLEEAASDDTLSPYRWNQLLNLLADSADKKTAPNFSHIRKGATQKQFQKELQYLLNTGTIFCVNKEKKSFRYEFADAGILRYLKNDYEVFLRLEEDLCPKYILQQYVYSTMIRNGYDITCWQSKRGAAVSYVSFKDHIAIDCDNSAQGYRRNLSSMQAEYPDFIILSCGLNQKTDDILYVAIWQILSKKPLDEITLWV